VSEPQPRKRSISSIRIRGLAERADSPVQPLGPVVAVPGTVPLMTETSPREQVGTATLHWDEQGIRAEGVIDLGAWERIPVNDRRQAHPAELWPKFAVGIEKPLVEKGIITSGRVAFISLVRENSDPDLPPWEVVTDPPGECGKCGTTFEYRDRFLWIDGRWTDRKVPDPYCPHCDDDLEHLYQLTHDLRFCGCGDPESVYDLVRDLLGLFERKSEELGKIEPGASTWSGAYDEVQAISQQIADRIGGGDGVYYAVLYLIDGAGLLEHGTSIRTSWLTAKGKHYLSLMRLHDYRDMEGPGGLIYGFPHEGARECGPGCRHWEASTEDYRKREIAKAGNRGEEETG
jgi:hypothetical protein